MRKLIVQDEPRKTVHQTRITSTSGLVGNNRRDLERNLSIERLLTEALRLSHKQKEATLHESILRLSLPRKKKNNCERLTVFQLKSRLEKLAAMEEWLLSSHKEELQAMSLRHKECVFEKKTIVEKDQRGKSCVSGGSSNKWPPP